MDQNKLNKEQVEQIKFNKPSVALIVILIIILAGAITVIVLFALTYRNYSSCNSTTNSIVCNSVNCFFDNTQCCSSYQSNCSINNWFTGKDTSGELYYKAYPDTGVPPPIGDENFNICLQESEKAAYEAACLQNPDYSFCPKNRPPPSCATNPNNKIFCGFGNTEQLPIPQNVSINTCYFMSNPKLLEGLSNEKVQKLKDLCVNISVKGLYSFAWKTQNPAYSYEKLFS